MALASLAEWDNFYVITGSSAAGLIGLTFVVIALSADTRRVNPIGVRVFVTPTIIHFGAVLFTAAFLSMPRQSALGVSLGLGAVGCVGLSYAGVIVAHLRAMVMDYVPVVEDWVWNAILPLAAYGVLLAAAVLIWRCPEQSLYGIAVASMLLLAIGIHNAWDVAVWNTVRKKPE
jgi:hypothetical protein